MMTRSEIAITKSSASLTYKKKNNRSQTSSNSNKCKAPKATNMIKIRRAKAATTKDRAETIKNPDTETTRGGKEEIKVAEEDKEAITKASATKLVITNKRIIKDSMRMVNASGLITKGKAVEVPAVAKAGKINSGIRSTIAKSTISRKFKRIQTTASFTALTTIFSLK